MSGERDSNVVENFHPPAEQAISGILFTIFSQAFREIEDVDGAVFGGSYAKGTYQLGDDIDFDILTTVFIQPNRRLVIAAQLQRYFSVSGLTAEVRDFVPETEFTDETRWEHYDELHPDSPFIVRDEHVAKVWGLKVNPER